MDMVSFAPLVTGNMMLLIPLRQRMDTFVSDFEISSDQYNTIVNNFTNDEILDAEMMGHDFSTTGHLIDEVRAMSFTNWIDGEVAGESMTMDIADHLRSLFGLGPSTVYEEITTPLSNHQGPVPKNYVGNGLVEFFARSDFGAGLSDSDMYNGIWGYSVDNREYALQCSSAGLNILDVTTDNIVKIQTIQMSGGEVWRDVATHLHYAYVAAQGGANPNLWVIDLSELAGGTAEGADSNPISFTKRRQVSGYSGWGHTLNIWNGLLFLNSARGGLGGGCKIFELRNTPMYPEELHTYTGGDCHDSFVKSINNRDIMFVADGSKSKFRFIDITNIRNPDYNFIRVGQTPTEVGAYAHQNVVSDDGTKLFVTEETNQFHMAVYNITDLEDPLLIKKFQLSEYSQFNNILVHNAFIRGNFLMVAYYSAGFRLFDITDVYNIVEVGKYETFRDPNGEGGSPNISNNGYNGAWNIYVDLPSGKVLISDLDHGTFVVNINPIPPTLSPTIYMRRSQCADSPLKFRTMKNEVSVLTDCAWVAKKNTPNRCSLDHVSQTCPSTCRTCSVCIDSLSRFQFVMNGSIVTKSCTWLQKSTNIRCAISGISETCRTACSLCVI